MSAWDGDKELSKYYDSNCTNRSLDGFVEDTCHKILEYKEFSDDCLIYGLTERTKKVGFVVLNRTTKLLYSFGVGKNYRDAEHLSTLFDFITGLLRQDFTCLLFRKNKRAVTWLQKCGLKEKPIHDEKLSESIIVLKYN